MTVRGSRNLTLWVTTDRIGHVPHHARSDTSRPDPRSPDGCWDPSTVADLVTVLRLVHLRMTGESLREDSAEQRLHASRLAPADPAATPPLP
jgi:hypothetical protein